jgi:hypothetical protein
VKVAAGSVPRVDLAKAGSVMMIVVVATGKSAPRLFPKRLELCSSLFFVVKPSGLSPRPDLTKNEKHRRSLVGF